MPLPNLCVECDKPLLMDERMVCQKCFEDNFMRDSKDHVDGIAEGAEIEVTEEE